MEVRPGPDRRAGAGTSAPDEELVIELYRQEAGHLVGMIHSYCRDRSVAEEVVQESFIRLRQSLSRLEDRERAASYLRSIAFNLARSRFRHQAVVDRHRPAAAAGAVRTPEDHYLLADDQRVVVEALGRLSDRQRACLVLRYYEDLSEREIAATLGMSPNSVKVHVRRGMKALSAILEDRR